MMMLIFLGRLGFCFTLEECVSTERVDYLGNIIHPDSMEILLPTSRLDAIVRGCQGPMDAGKAPTGELASIDGSLVPAAPARETGPL